MQARYYDAVTEEICEVGTKKTANALASAAVRRVQI